MIEKTCSCRCELHYLLDLYGTGGYRRGKGGGKKREKRKEKEEKGEKRKIGTKRPLNSPPPPTSESGSAGVWVTAES